MNRRNVLSAFVGALVALTLVGVTRAEAQSAGDFVGKWTITFAPPAGMPGGGAGGPPGAGPAGGGGPGGGGFRAAPTVLEVTQSGNALAATMTGGFGMGGGQGAAPEPRPISDVKVVDGSLVLTYTMTMGPNGDSTPVTLKLTRDGATMKAEQDLGNGRVRSGTAVKE